MGTHSRLVILSALALLPASCPTTVAGFGDGGASGDASPDTAPLNLVIDAHTMRILRKYLGNQGAVIWPYIESELARRSSR